MRACLLPIICVWSSVAMSVESDQMVADAPDPVARGKQRVESRTVPGLTVCFWKGDEVHVVEQTDEHGVEQADIYTASAGQLLHSVSGPHVNVVTGAITVRGCR